jgi:hypothetical protein
LFFIIDLFGKKESESGFMVWEIIRPGIKARPGMLAGRNDVARQARHVNSRLPRPGQSPPPARHVPSRDIPGQRRRSGVFAAGFIRGAARITHESCRQATAIGSRLKKDSPAPCQIRIVPGSLSDSGLLYCGKADSGRFVRSFSSNSDGYSPQTTGQNTSKPFSLATTA